MTRSPKRCPLLILLGLTVGLIATGCHREASDKDALADVNGDKISRTEVDKEYNRQSAGASQRLSPVEEQALRLSLVRQIIAVRLQLQRAEKMKIAPTHDEVDAKFNQAKAPFTKEEFEKRLKETALTEDEFKQEIRRSLTIEKLQNQEIASKVSVAEADIQAYYDQHKSDFNLTEPRYDIAHIIVTNEPQPQAPGKAQNEAQALAKIRMVYGRLESGDDFSQLAVRYSEDPESARNGGALGTTSESQLKLTDPNTRAAILQLKPGGYSKPIAVSDPQSHRQIGYRIVRLVGKEAAGQRELNDPAVQQFIRNRLRQEREQVLKAAYDAVLYDGAEIHNYYARKLLKDAAAK